MTKLLACTAVATAALAVLLQAPPRVAAAGDTKAGESQEPWEAPPEAKKLENPVKTDPKTVERGKRSYRQFCMPCHGASGIGDGPMAKEKGYKPANLTLQRLNQQVDGEIFWKISKGKKPMPSFDKDLTPRERWDVVSYVRTLLRELR